MELNYWGVNIFFVRRMNTSLIWTIFYLRLEFLLFLARTRFCVWGSCICALIWGINTFVDRDMITPQLYKLWAQIHNLSGNCLHDKNESTNNLRDDYIFFLERGILTQCTCLILISTHFSSYKDPNSAFIY